MQPLDFNPENPLMTEQEVAEYLSVKLYTVRNWRKNRQIPFIKLGNKIRYLKVDVEKFIMDNRYPLTDDMEKFVQEKREIA